jgi:signal transduction histidine kinase
VQPAVDSRRADEPVALEGVADPAVEPRLPAAPTSTPRSTAGPTVTALELEVSDLRAEIEALHQACKLKDQYLSVATHELSAPLAAMKAYIEALIEHHTDPSFTHTGEFLGVLGRETERLIRLVNRTLEISRLTYRGVRQVLEPTSIAEVVTEIHPSLQPVLDERRIRLDVQVHRDLACVAADRDLLKQVLLNLVHNAVKFSPPGRKVTVRATARGSQVEVEVQDEGYGIAPHELGRLFEPYFRSGDQRVERERGTGLGLSIVKTIVEQHGGRIEVQSLPEMGTTFRFTLRKA